MPLRIPEILGFECDLFRANHSSPKVIDDDIRQTVFCADHQRDERNNGIRGDI